MATQMIGTITEFNSSFDDWNVYHERLEQFFEVNDVPPEKQSAFLISVIGSNAYKSLRDLCHPVLPKDKPFAELCELLRKQFSPQVSIFRERVKFYNARQTNYENVTQWYGNLKRLSVDCKFGGNLQAILLDKFITGLRPGQVLDRLCEESEKLQLEQALDIAINKECAGGTAGVATPFKPLAGSCFPMPRTCLFGGEPARQYEGVAAKTIGGEPSRPFGVAAGFGSGSSPMRLQTLGFDGAITPQLALACAPAPPTGFGAAANVSDDICDEEREVPDVCCSMNDPVPEPEAADGVPKAAAGADGSAGRGRGGRFRKRGRRLARRTATDDGADRNSVVEAL